MGIFIFGRSLAAQAGGLYFPSHGVRGVARAGSFVAGGDDPGALWYNPAALGNIEGVQTLLDASLIFFNLQYQRVDSGGNQLPEISNTNPLLPVPTIALAAGTFFRRLRIGMSLDTPYAAMPQYPSPNYNKCTSSPPANCIDTAHLDAPQRYSLISLNGTIFINLELDVAVEILPGLTIGAAIQNMFAHMAARSAITNYNGGISSGPEDPDYDTLTQMNMSDYFSPSAKFGALYVINRHLRLGAAVQLPYQIGGPATIDLQLPASSVYSTSSVEGNQADVNFSLPLIIRAGLEWRSASHWRVELSADWERWSILDALNIEPHDIYIINLLGIDRYKAPSLSVPLNLRDTYSGRLGSEYAFNTIPLILRAGYLYERGAVDDAYASVFAADTNKHVFSCGFGYSYLGYRLDFLFAQSLFAKRQVNYLVSKTPQINPINSTGAAMVGAGNYRSAYSVIGIGLNKLF